MADEMTTDKNLGQITELFTHSLMRIRGVATYSLLSFSAFPLVQDGIACL